MNGQVPLRVLYVNHTSQVSGAEHSLLTLLRALPDEVEATVACPDGPLAEALGELGVAWRPVPGTAGSLRLHPWHTARAVAEIAAEAAAVRRLGGVLRADLVHANSIRAGIATCLGGGAPRAIVQVRDCLPPGRAAALSLKAIDRRAALVLANSVYTEQCFSRVAAKARTSVLHSPVDLDRFDPALLTKAEARARHGIAADTAVLVVVAQLTPWKGQDDAVRLVARLRERHPGIRLLLVGSAKFVSGATRYDNTDYLRRLEGLVASLDLEEEVSFLGERGDVPELLRAADVLLAPSWEEPFGRSVVEAMAMEVPVVATDVGGPAESVRDGVDGYLVPPRDPGRWVRPTAALLESPELRARMGASGRQRVVDLFSTSVHVRRLLSLYRETMERPRR